MQMVHLDGDVLSLWTISGTKLAAFIFLDDPHRESISIADLKSFFAVEEEQTTSGRYNDANLIRNCVRAYASNDLDQSDEPEDDSRTFITGEESLKLTRRIFAGDKHADVLA